MLEEKEVCLDLRYRNHNLDMRTVLAKHIQVDHLVVWRLTVYCKSRIYKVARQGLHTKIGTWFPIMSTYNSDRVGYAPLGKTDESSAPRSSLQIYRHESIQDFLSLKC